MIARPSVGGFAAWPGRLYRAAGSRYHFRPCKSGSLAMSYMLLVLQPPGEVVEGAEGRLRYDRMMGFARSLAKRGVLVSGESLGSDLTAVRVRKRTGKATAIDGPFAEAKEIVGGFFLVNCPTKAEAVAIAHECPATEWATVEVRELGPCWNEAVRHAETTRQAGAS
jgi:hypothetical protein